MKSKLYVSFYLFPKDYPFNTYGIENMRTLFIFPEFILAAKTGFV